MFEEAVKVMTELFFFFIFFFNEECKSNLSKKERTCHNSEVLMLQFQKVEMSSKMSDRKC